MIRVSAREKCRAELDSCWFTSFDLPVWGRARAQDRRLRELYHVECGTQNSSRVPEARTPASTSPGRLRGTRLPVTTVRVHIPRRPCRYRISWKGASEKSPQALQPRCMQLKLESARHTAQ